MSFITVKYADNRIGIFNPNCKSGVLLGHIKEHCGLNPADNIDLSDEEGHVKQLHDNLDDYATKFVEDREILVLLRVNKIMDDELAALKEAEESNYNVTVTYTPLLDLSDDPRSFLAALNPDFNKIGKTKSSNKKYDALVNRKSSDAKYRGSKS